MRDDRNGRWRALPESPTVPTAMRALSSSISDGVRPARGPERVLTVLEVLSGRDIGIPTLVVAQMCGIPRSSAHVLLAAMRRRGFVAYDDHKRIWSLGDAARLMASGPTPVDAMLAILESFDRHVRHQTALEIASRTGLDLARIRPTIDSLVAHGLLTAEPGGRYMLGVRLLGLGARLEPVDHLRTLARPHLVALRNVTRETANLVVRDGLDAVYLDQVESQRSLRHSGWSGRAIPIAGTATGAALSGEFGAKVAADAVESGVTAVACRIPIDHAPAAAVSVIGPTFRLRGSILQHVRTEVESAARRIAEDLHRAAEHGPY